MANGARGYSDLPDPPNPPPPPFTGPNAVTGSGRTAFIVPTFVPNRAGTPATGYAPAHPQAPAAHAAYGAGVAPAMRDAYAPDEEMGGYDDVHGNYADEMGTQSPYDQPYDDDAGGYAEEGYDDEYAESDAARPMAADRRARTGGKAPAKPQKKGGQGLLVVLILLLLVGGAAAGYVAMYGIPGMETPGNNTAGDDGGIIAENTPAGNTTDGGAISVNGTANNNAGTASTEFTFTWEIEPPAVTPNRVFKSRLSVKAPYPVSQVKLNGESIATPNATEFDVTIDLNLPDAFDDKFVLKFIPPSSLRVTPKELPLRIAYDADRPTISLEGPDPPDVAVLYRQSRSFSLTLKATDSNPKRMEFEGDEFLPETEASGQIIAPKTFNFPSEGRYPLRATAEDKAGNRTEWNKTVVVDITAPGIRVNGQNSLEWTADRDQITATLVISDPNGVAAVSVDGVTQSVPGNHPTQVQVMLARRLQPGLNQFRVEARDVASNTRTEIVRVTFLPNPLPVISQVDIDGQRIWVPADGDMPGALQYIGESEKVSVAVYFDYLAAGQPRGTLNGHPISIAAQGGRGRYYAEGEVALTGRRTEIAVRIEGADPANFAEFAVALLRTPFPEPVMPLADAQGLAIDRTFPPSGNATLDADRLAADFAPTADGGVVVAIAGPPGKIVRYEADGAEQWSRELPAAGDAVAILNPATIIARTLTGDLHLIDAATGEWRRQMSVKSAPGSAMCALSANRFAVQLPTGEVAIVDVTGAEPLVFPLPGQPTGPMVAIGDRRDVLLGRGGITLLSRIHRRPVWSSGENAADLAVTANGQWIAATTTGQLVQRAGNRVLTTQDAHAGAAEIAVLPDGRIVSVGPTAGAAEGYTWIVWSPDMASRTLETAGPWVADLKVGPDGRLWCLMNGYVVRFAEIR